MSLIWTRCMGNMDHHQGIHIPLTMLSFPYCTWPCSCQIPLSIFPTTKGSIFPWPSFPYCTWPCSYMHALLSLACIFVNVNYAEQQPPDATNFSSAALYKINTFSWTTELKKRVHKTSWNLAFSVVLRNWPLQRPSVQKMVAASFPLCKTSPFALHHV